MNVSAANGGGRIDWAPGNRSSFSRMTVLLERKYGLDDWECPYCSHSIGYEPYDADAAQMAIESHLLRRHRSDVLGRFKL